MQGNNLKRSRMIIAGIFLIIVATMITVLVLYEKEPDNNDGKITVGFCADNLVIERWQRDQEIFQAKAKDRGVEVIVYNANEDNELQNLQIRQLIEARVDVIVIIPYDKDGISEAVSEAQKAGIKVIAYDRLINNADIDAYISFDNLKVGQLQAEALIKEVPEGNYVLINGSPDDNNSSMFREGYMSVLDEHIGRGKIQIVAEEWADNWREEPAYDVVTDTLNRDVQIDAIIGANDRLAEAAIRALSEKGLGGEIVVAGHDADISACQRIVEGTQHITVYKPIRLLAETAVELAIDLAMNNDIESTVTIDNGFKEVPYIKLDVLPVTLETMEETVIADGFHSKADIYREEE